MNEIASSCTYPHVWLDQSLGVAVYSVVVYSVVVYSVVVYGVVVYGVVVIIMETAPKD